MAVLVSPGVDVQIIDESYYGSAGAGTVPLIVIATAHNKASPSGSGIAPYTVPSEAGKVFLIGSQRELIQNFGNPNFYSVQGTPMHGHELNEYGLHAAYQYLGVSNRAYVLRADIDLAQLESSDSAPRGEPVGGTYWLDLNETIWGLFESNGNFLPGAAWTSQNVKVVTEENAVLSGSAYVPASSFGADGDYAVVTVSSDNKFYEKVSGSWYAIGTNAWKAAHPTSVVGVSNPTTLVEGSTFTINGSTVTVGATGTLAALVTNINGLNITNITASISNNALKLTNTAGGNIVIGTGVGTALTVLGLSAGTTKGVDVYRTNDAQYPANSVSGDIWIKGSSPNRGAAWSVKLYNAGISQWVKQSAPLYPYNSTLSDGNVAKDTAAFAGLGAPAVGVIYVGYDAATGVQTIRRWNGTRYEDLVYEASIVAPSTEPAAGTYWFSSDFRADIMVSDGNTWLGYRRRYPATDVNGVIIAGSAPTSQSTGDPLVDNDLWIDTSDLEAYPALYRYNATDMRWRRVDLTDQTTPFGIMFADARQNTGTTFVGIANDGDYTFESEDRQDMLLSDFLDPDAPDPRTTPDGMLLFNTRYSTYNVKQWQPEYFLDGEYDPNTNYVQTDYTVGDPSYVFPALTNAGRWVTMSGNRYDGAAWMGRKAQRAVIVRAMAAALAANEDIRSELVFYNLIAAPGYPELIDEMLTLNVDIKEHAFIIGDTPARLKPLTNDLQRWAQNAANTPSNGEDGLVSHTPYLGVYYPWGLSTNIDGSEIMVPPSTMVLRTIAYSDSISYVWFAPAGFQRGLVSNATSVGYLTEENEFRPILMSQGQRDVMYLNRMNPIAYIVNRGLVVYGQKTTSALDSALDRVNVARLANYLKYTLDNMMKPFLFEQNDQQTRDSVKLTVERFMANLISLRALEDFAVLCDETNNTPARRDRNELWVDILIKPIKAIEFIYVPVRIRNSSDNLDFNIG